MKEQKIETADMPIESAESDDPTFVYGTPGSPTLKTIADIEGENALEREPWSEFTRQGKNEQEKLPG